MANHRRPKFKVRYFIPTGDTMDDASIRAGLRSAPTWPYRVDHLADIPHSQYPASHRKVVTQ